MAWSEWAGIASTSLVGLAGAFFANSIRRRTRAEVEREVAQKRFAAYGALWALMSVASPTLIPDETHGEPLDRRALFDDLTAWYYRNGNGMLLSHDARNVYLTVKTNLLCPHETFLPAAARENVASDDAERERLVIRQFALLRMTMRSDLAIYTTPWGGELTDEDIAFLCACGVDVSGELWRQSLPRPRTPRQEAHVQELAADPPTWLSQSIGFPPAHVGRDHWLRSALTVKDIHRRLERRHRRLKG
jgi:hypothetical protein